MDVRQAIRKLEDSAELPEGKDERFIGYGVMGLTFSSGHILVLRRFFKTSIGPEYTSIWHRNENNDWTFYVDHDPNLTCPRYFGNSIKKVVINPIEINWYESNSLQVKIVENDLFWDIQFGSSVITHLMNGFSSIIPEVGWKNPTVLNLFSKTASYVLRTGKVNLYGRVPNGQHYIANPRKIWLVKKSHAEIDGKDIGSVGPLKKKAGLGDFLIPQRGIFAAGQAYFDTLDKNVHKTNTTMAGS